MRSLRVWVSRAAGWFGALRRREQFEAELQSHLEMHIDELVRSGLTPDEARRRALAAAGGLQAAREAYRDRGGLPALDVLGQDMRFAARMLRKSPGFTATAVLVLALGIGANGVMFSLINALLLRPIVPGGNEIVGLYSGSTVRPDAFRLFSYPEYVDIRERNDVFESLIAEWGLNVGLTENGVTTVADAMRVSSNYFAGLGVRLAAGRSFTADEERPGSGAAVAIVNHEYWRRHGLAPDVIGRDIIVNGRPLTIVGVAPEGFRGTIPVMSRELWLPLGAADGVDATRHPLGGAISLAGALKNGISIAEAEARLATLAAALAAAYPESSRDQRLVVHTRSRTGLGPRPRSDTEPMAAATLLMAISGLVLLVACLNLANMLLAKGSVRRQEIAVRVALGGGRGRILRQLLVEGMMVAIVGSIAAIALGWWAAHRLLAALGHALGTNIFLDISPDVRVVAAMVVACVVSTLLFALGPAWKLSKADVVAALKQGMPIGRARVRRVTMPGLMVGGQVALSLVLLICAGAFLRAGANAAASDAGFPLEGGLLVQTDAGLARLDEAEGRVAYRRVLERLRALPEVRAASAASVVPLSGTREGRVIRRDTETVVATFTVVAADYFATLSLPVLSGREFTAAEEQGVSADPVVVIDQTLARRLFPSGDALGQLVRVAELGDSAGAPARIVGIVRAVRDEIISPASAHVYAPVGQHYRPGMTMHVRTVPGREAALLDEVRDAVRSADERLPILAVKTLTNHRDTAPILGIIVMAARLFGAFGTIALVLATAGVYGLRAYLVAQRTRELGIRVALGATRRDIVGQLLREGAGVTAVGMTAGLLLALGLIRVLRQSEMLYEVRTFDPVILGSAVLLLAAAVLGASYIPSRRAVRIDPAVALRPE
jgi:predicted permease